MQLTKITTVVSISFLSAILAVSASPIAEPAQVEARDIFLPPITLPSAETVWESRKSYSVTWDTTVAPVNITNPRGSIRLRKDDSTGFLVLAHDFDILSGKTKVDIPLVLEGEYQIVLFGNSGNFSPKFTIKSGIPY